MRGIYLESFFDDMFSSIKSDKNAYSTGRCDFPGNHLYAIQEIGVMPIVLKEPKGIEL